MFSKSRITEGEKKPAEAEANRPSETQRAPADLNAGPPKPKPAPSALASDLVIKGNVRTTGDIQIEGTVEGDIRAHLLTVGEGATVKGEVMADDVVVNGRIVGRVRGLKVRLTSTARVEGDIIHKTIAIESGAHFEGSVQRRDDPMNDQSGSQRVSAATAQASQPAQPTQQTVQNGGAGKPTEPASAKS
jgi:cytoskeletal protein CcmA (bactofilin family)